MNKRIIFTLILLVNFFAQANINNLRDTLTILKPEFYEHSILHGAVAWEKEWVMNIWDLAWERKKADAAANEIKNELIEPEKAPALIRVIDKTFHRPPNTMGPMNFTPTDSIKQKNPEIIAKAIAGILFLVHKNEFNALISKYQQIQQILKVIQLEPELFDDSEKLQNLAIEIKRLQGHAEVDKFCLKFLSELKRKQYEKEKTNPTFKDFSENVTAFYDKKSGIKLAESDKKHLAGLAKVLSISTNDLMYAFFETPKEASLALLALLWYCCKNTKSLIATYYQTLDQIFKEAGFAILVDENIEWTRWNETMFASKNVRQIQQDLETALSTGASEYEKIIYLSCLPGKYPNISGHSKPILWMNEQKTFDSSNQPITFADCMEATIMNIILILAYNPESKTFELETLKKRVGVAFVNPKLEMFFSGMHPALVTQEGIRIAVTPETTGCLKVHEAFTDVISNIEGVTYRNVRQVDGTVNASFSKYTYLPFVTNTKYIDKLTKKGYAIAGPNDICFNLRASLANVIIVLNYLLNLNLFKPQSLYTKILNPDFVKSDLPKLAQKLQIRLEPSVSLDLIDNNDYAGQIITNIFVDETPIPQFQLSTASEHGEIIPCHTENQMFEFLKKISKKLFNNDLKLISLHGLDISLLNNKELSAGHWVEPSNFNYIDLFWVNGLTKTPIIVRKKITGYAIYSILKAFNKQHLRLNDQYANFFLRAINTQTNDFIRLSSYLDLCEYLNILNPSENFLQKLSSYTQKGILSDNTDLQFASIKIFQTLSEKKYYAPEAITAAVSGIHSSNPDIQEEAVALLKYLIQNKFGLDKILSATTELAQSQNSTNKYLALDLFITLIEQNTENANAIGFALEESKSPLPMVRQKANQLFKLLLNNKNNYGLIASNVLDRIKMGKATKSQISELITILAGQIRKNPPDPIVEEALPGWFNKILGRHKPNIKTLLISLALILVNKDLSLSINLLSAMLDVKLITDNEILNLIETIRDRNVAKTLFKSLFDKLENSPEIEKLVKEFDMETFGSSN